MKVKGAIYRFQPKADFGKKSHQKTFHFRFSTLGQAQGELRAPLFVACYTLNGGKQRPLDFYFS
jgi:hypothetical protein